MDKNQDCIKETLDKEEIVNTEKIKEEKNDDLRYNK